MKNVRIKREKRARLSAWLIFLSMLCAAFPSALSARENRQSDDSVFCPLQKIWVQKYAAPVREKDSLGEICASGGRKNRFYFEVSKKIPFVGLIRDGAQAEKLFFNYLEKGRRALAEIAPASQNLPSSQIGRLASGERSGASRHKTDFCKTESETFVFAQKPRPPTARKFVLFSTVPFRKLDDISRSIKPRAPPVSF